MHGVVNDHAGLLSPEAVQRIQQRVGALEHSRSYRVCVLTVESLGGDPPGEFAARVVRGWGLAQQDSLGALLLVSLRDHKVRIEVPALLRLRLGEKDCKQIIGQVVPLLSSGAFDAGIEAGVSGIADILSVPPGPPLVFTGREFGMFLLVLLIAVTLAAILSRGTPLLRTILCTASMPAAGFALGTARPLVITLGVCGLILGASSLKWFHGSGAKADETKPAPGRSGSDSSYFYDSGGGGGDAMSSCGGDSSGCGGDFGCDFGGGCDGGGGGD